MSLHSDRRDNVSPGLSGRPERPGPARDAGVTPLCRCATKIDMADLLDLIHARTLVLRIPAFIQPARCEKLAQALMDAPLHSGYENLPKDDLTKIGQTLYEAVSGPAEGLPERIEQYLKNAAECTAQLRQICAPHGGYPMDEIAAHLARVCGAVPLELMNKPSFVGLVRLVKDGNAIHPHTDDLTEDLPEHPYANSLKQEGAGQLAVNIYLRTAAIGGDLQIWKRKPTAHDFETKRLPHSSYGLDPKKFELPDLQMAPEVGELVFFNSSFLHAVTAASGGSRVSVSFFLGINAALESRYWS